MNEPSSSPSDLPQLKTSHLKNEAYKVIKQGITELRFRPGDPVNENDLARLLGISKTPVRNALVRLEQEGLVITAPFRGTYVTPVSARDVREIYEVRGALEELAIRKVVSHLPPDEITKLFHVIDEATDNVQHGKLNESFKSIRLFHEGLVNATGNRWMINMYDSLSAHLARIRNICGHIPGRVEKSNAEHRAILEAIASVDSEQAIGKLRLHLDSLAADYVSAAGEALKTIEVPAATIASDTER